ncbi:N-acetylneuraminate lyase B [Leptinotarsa decemlineata]|uniref:N-acetylneuraminate lyase B n=1 Tax=Leptinotarsa decemlineata TaxID=7539 RepID=UPI000C25417F|nr:N-acetylneuraminate lyase B-like [Leptinotarsa decemlineata]
MEHFEIGCCFKSYNELIEKLKEYCEITCTKFTTKDSRLITNEFASAKESFVYSELKLICVHGRTPKIKGGEKKRKIRTLKIKKTECPAYFRIKLINSGVALQIVAMNDKHNHPLEKIEVEEPPKTKKKKGSYDKNISSFKLEIKNEDSVSSEDMQPSEFIEVYIDRDDPDQKVEFSFRGLCAPVFNVFTEDNSLNVSIIPEYAKYLADGGITAVLVNDIMGECTSMSVSERKSVTEEWMKAVKITNQHIMVQVGGCALPDVVDLAKHAEKVGVDSILCLPEVCFEGSTPKELVEYLKIVSQAAPNTPLLYHHIPKRTNVDTNIMLILEECTGKIPTFCGINYTSNDLEEGVAALEIDSKKNVVFFGADKLLVGAFSMGFDSAIIPSLNIFPEYGKCILEAVDKSKLEEARKLQRELSIKYDVISKFGALVPAMKAAMNIATSINVGLVRPPLKNLSDEQIENMKNLLGLE